MAYRRGEVLKNWLLSSTGRHHLSPAEKFDLYVGSKNFQLTNYERNRTGVMYKSDIPSWEGLCHAWALAAYLYKEPRPVLLKVPMDKRSEFGSSDIKALLTYHLHLNRPNRKTKFLGSRCNLDAKKTNIEGRPECDDTNAGAFRCSC